MAWLTAHRYGCLDHPKEMPRDYGDLIVAFQYIKGHTPKMEKDFLPRFAEAERGPAVLHGEEVGLGWP